MFGARDDLVIPIAAADSEPLLEFWRWLVPAGLRPYFATALGDLFLRDPAGRVWWLDVGPGELQPVAADEAEFRTLLTDPANADLWLGGPLADQLAAAGNTRGPGECYSYKLLPVLGGEFDPSNFVVYDPVTHFRIWGPIHEQIRHLPVGTAVEFRVAEPPG